MDFLPIALGVGVAIVVIGGIAVVIIKSRGAKEEEYEIIEEEAPVLLKIEEEEEEQGCPEDVKQRLLQKQEKIYRDANKVYLVITNLLKNKQLPSELKKELDTFIRSYNRLKELKEEIEVYPFADCERVFELKFNFYNKLIKETAQKIMVMAKSIR